MADEREGSRPPTGQPATETKSQTAGREANAAQPLNAAKDRGGPERYPSAPQDEAAERTGRVEQVTGEKRSFDPSADAPTPRQGAGDGGPPVGSQEGRLGPAGDPAEGKR